MEPSNCPMPETLERFGVNSCRIRNLHLDNSTLFDKPHNHDACKNTCDPLGDNDNGTESDTVDRSSLQHVFLATITASAPPEKKSYIVRNYITSTDSCPESVLVGASLLWVGWFGFNAGSALEANGFLNLLVSRNAVSTGRADRRRNRR